MVTGICRFTKGEFNQAALDEVWNKGRELYKPEVAPPASGVVPMTADVIWNDSYYPPQQFPCAHSEFNYGYLNRQHTPSKTFRPGPENGSDDWVKSNVYWEICERAVKDESCAYSQSTSTNTWVQAHGCSYYYLRSGQSEWDTLFEGHPPKYDHGQTNPPASQPYKKCTNPELMDWMDSTRGDQIYFHKDGIDYYKPSGGGSYPHPWADVVHFPEGHVKDIIAVCAQMYVRLVQIDMNEPNDFEDTEYVTYCGTDSKKADGYRAYDIAVQGHFRSIDKSGKWVPFGVIAGIPDKATFDANPPPLAPTDGLPVF